MIGHKFSLPYIHLVLNNNTQINNSNIFNSLDQLNSKIPKDSFGRPIFYLKK